METASTASTQNGARQPIACPANAPSGTPMTFANMAPAPTTPRAREVAAGPVTRAATTLATAQNAPVASAVKKRAASSSAKLEPSATTTCPAAKTPSAAISVTRLGRRSVSIAINGAPTIIPSAKTVIDRPARAVVTCRFPAICGSRPDHHELSRAHQERPERQHVDDEREPGGRAPAVLDAHVARGGVEDSCSHAHTPSPQGGVDRGVNSTKPACSRAEKAVFIGGTSSTSCRQTTASVDDMDNRADNRSDIRGFLASRRAKLTPEQVGLPTGSRRRVPGLRREEVAVLAGVSTEWYTRLEKGHISGVSEDVLDAVARTLQLDEAERTYLFDLARATRPGHRTPTRRKDVEVAPSVQWLLDSITMSAAFVRNGRMDVVATNPLARALHAPMFDSSTTGKRGRANFARYHFLDPGAHHFFVDWDAAANATVSLLARRKPGASPTTGPCANSSASCLRSAPEFRTLSGRPRRTRTRHDGIKRLQHPEVGRLELTYQIPGPAHVLPALCTI